MQKNDNFFKQNERFKGLIKHYANKIGDSESENDLWGFLWILQNTTFLTLPDKYICVCLRNKYYDIMRERKKHTHLPLNDNACDNFNDLDKTIDLKNAFAKLEAEEKALIYKHFVVGESYTNLAKKDSTTRQAKSQKARRILNKMRGFF